MLLNKCEDANELVYYIKQDWKTTRVQVMTLRQKTFECVCRCLQSRGFPIMFMLLCGNISFEVHARTDSLGTYSANSVVNGNQLVVTNIALSSVEHTNFKNDQIAQFLYSHQTMV